MNQRGSNIMVPGLQYIGAHQVFVLQNRLVCLKYPLYWSPLTTALRNIILWLIEDPFLSWINPIQMDWVLLNLICVIAKKYFRHTSLFCMTNVWWAPIYWSPSVQKTSFLFYFWTWNTANKRFPVHYLDHHVIHKTWFYQNSPSSFLPRILKIKFRGSNVLEPGSNILEPPHLPDCLLP